MYQECDCFPIGYKTTICGTSDDNYLSPLTLDPLIPETRWWPAFRIWFHNEDEFAFGLLYVTYHFNRFHWWDLNVDLGTNPEPNKRPEIIWWRHQMEIFSALLAICAGNSPAHGEFPTQRPVTRSFDIFFDLRPNKRLSKHWWGWWFETPSSPLWRYWNEQIEYRAR